MRRMTRWVCGGVLLAAAGLPLPAQGGAYDGGLRRGYGGGYNDLYDHRRYDTREEYNRTHAGIRPGGSAPGDGSGTAGGARETAVGAVFGGGLGGSLKVGLDGTRQSWTGHGSEPGGTGLIETGLIETGPSEPGQSWTTEQLLTSTVHEAWMMSGRNEGQFFAMVKQLAAMSAQKRGLMLPEAEAAGRKAGELIRKEARKDPDQLLYAVVDRAVMKTGAKSAGVAAARAAK